MPRKIEDAFNDCFERLMSGESLESCVGSYPEYAEELLKYANDRLDEALKQMVKSKKEVSEGKIQ